LAEKILPEGEKRNFMNYGLYLERARASGQWLDPEKKLSFYKIGPEVQNPLPPHLCPINFLFLGLFTVYFEIKTCDGFGIQ